MSFSPQAAREAARAEDGTAAMGPQSERAHIEHYAEFVETYETMLEEYIHIQVV